jgi:hypothetical protein
MQLVPMIWLFFLLPAAASSAAASHSSPGVSVLCPCCPCFEKNNHRQVYVSSTADEGRRGGNVMNGRRRRSRN